MFKSSNAVRSTLAGLMILTPVAAVAQSGTASVELPPLFVTVDPLGQREPDDLSRPVIVLTGEELERKRRATIGELLSEELGVSSSDFGPGVGRPVIRGQSGARVLVLDNGTRVMDIATIGADHANSVDPLHADQVEVIKGPYTLVHGSGASAGVVNVRNRRIRPDIPEGFAGTADLSFSDNANERLGAVNLEYGAPGFRLQADYAQRRADDFDIPGFSGVEREEGRIDERGTMENSSVEGDSGGVSATLVGDRGYFGFGVSRLESDYGLPEIEVEFDAMGNEVEREFERVRMEQTRYELRGQRNDPFAGFTALRINVAYTDFEQQEIGFPFVNGQFEGEEVEADFENQEYEGRVELEHGLIGGWRGVVGTQVNDREFSALTDDGDTFYVPPTQSQALALFVVEERDTRWGRLELGGRVERNELEDERNRRDRSFTPLSLSAGAVIDLDALHHLKLNATRSQRAPVAEELYANGPHAAAGTFEIGNPELRVETSNNLEIGIDRHQGRWQWAVNLFYNRANDYIFLETQVDGNGDPIFVDGEDPTLPGDNLLTNYRQQDADFYGFEAETRYALIAGATPLNLRVFADQVRGELRDGGNLPRITPNRYGIGFDGGVAAVGYALNLSRIDDQTRIGQGETTTEGYSLLSADLTYTLYTPAGAAVLSLRGRNLLDEEARRHTSFFKDDAPLPGRAVIAGVRYSFGG